VLYLNKTVKIVAACSDSSFFVQLCIMITAVDAVAAANVY